MITNQAISNLGNLELQGSASSSGDSVYLFDGATEYAVQNAQSDSVTDLSANWNFAQFNVVGYANGSTAVFNSGSSITAAIQANAGGITAPTCYGPTGSTAETNNLNRVAAPAALDLPLPSILFEETYAGGGQPSCSVSGGGIVAFTGSPGQLFTYVPSLTATNLGLGMKAGTSPSIVAMAGGGYEEAFQANTGKLIVEGTAGDYSSGDGMLTGTSPSIAASPGGGFEVAFQSNTGYLWTYTPSGGGYDTGYAMNSGSSPAIAALPAGGYEVAFQSSAGKLTAVGSGGTLNSGNGMMAGTSPAIAAPVTGSDSFEIAFQANTGNLWTYSSAGSGTNTSLGMASGTSPGVAALTTGGYEFTFQANSNQLYVTGAGGSADIGQAMMANTSPAIAALPGGGFAEAVQTSAGQLMVFSGLGNVSGGNINSGQAMQSATSPSIAP